MIPRVRDYKAEELVNKGVDENAAAYRGPDGSAVPLNIPNRRLSKIFNILVWRCIRRNEASAFGDRP
jgi:hypothetical protein